MDKTRFLKHVLSRKGCSRIGLRLLDPFAEAMILARIDLEHRRHKRTFESAPLSRGHEKRLSSFPPSKCQTLQATQAYSLTTHPLHCHYSFADVFADSASRQ